jgi:microcystin-dependent protein
MSELSRYVGEIVKFPKPLNVQGLLRCDGSSYSEDEYPELFDVIGRLYGGTGSEFQVPLIPPSAFDASPYYIRATGLYGTIIDEDVSKFVGQIIFVAGNVDLSDLAIQPRGQKLAVLEYYALFTALGGVQTQETTEFKLPNLSDLQTLNGPAIKPYISLVGTFGPDYYESYLSEIQLLALPQVPSGMYACDGSVYLNRAAPMLAAVLDNPAAGDPKAFQLPYLSHRDGLPYTIVASGEALFPG